MEKPGEENMPKAEATTSTTKENSAVNNQEDPKVETESQANASATNTQEAQQKEPENAASSSGSTGSRSNNRTRSNRRSRSHRHVHEGHLIAEDIQYDGSTLIFDRVPDMFVRVSQPISQSTVFELICTRFFLESYRADANALSQFEDFTLEQETLPGFHPFCATPDCNCDM